MYVKNIQRVKFSKGEGDNQKDLRTNKLKMPQNSLVKLEVEKQKN